MFLSRPRIWLTASVALLLMAGVQALDGFGRSHALMINRSPSLPHWAFWVKIGAVPGRGEIVFFNVKHGPLVEKHFGKDVPAFGKYVYGLPGDLVFHDKGQVFISRGGTAASTDASGGQWPLVKPAGKIKPVSSLGEKLSAGPQGVIPEGCFYVGTPHRDSFDSRYAAIGFVCRHQIVGVAKKAIL